MLRHALTSLLALALVASPALAGKVIYDFGGTSWDIPIVKTTLSGSAKGVGIPGVKTKGKGTEEHSITIELTNDGGTTISGTFTADYDDGLATLTGTWTRKNECSKKLDLVFDANGEAELIDLVEKALAAVALDNGVVAEVDDGDGPNDTATTIAKTKVKLTIKTKTKKNEASAKLSLNHKMDSLGSSLAFQIISAPLKIKGKMKGTSNTQALTPLIVGD